jgi:hypothetical protein
MLLHHVGVTAYETAFESTVKCQLLMQLLYAAVLQDHLGRAEGYNIVHADKQFIVPTDGKPIRGLIQDHVVAGVEITCRCDLGV